MSIEEYKGKPREIGYQIGDFHRRQVTGYVEKRWNNLTAKTDEQTLMEFGSESLSKTKKVTPISTEELEGVAEAASVSPVRLFLVASYTDVQDFLVSRKEVPSRDRGSCTSLLYGKKEGGWLFGQTWDMPMDVEDMVSVIRKNYDLSNGVQKVTTLTLSFGLAHLGVNGGGLAVGTNNLGFSRQPTVQAALSWMRQTEPLSAHNYSLVDNREAVFMELTPEGASIINGRKGECLVHTNHYIENDFSDGAVSVSESSESRYGRAMSLGAKQRYWNIETLKEILSDQESIYRRPETGVGTVGGLVVDSEKSTAEIAREAAQNFQWLTVALNDK